MTRAATKTKRWTATSGRRRAARRVSGGRIPALTKPRENAESANGADHFQSGPTAQEMKMGCQDRAESPIHDAGLQPSIFLDLFFLGRWPRLEMIRAFGPKDNRSGRVFTRSVTRRATQEERARRFDKLKAPSLSRGRSLPPSIQLHRPVLNMRHPLLHAGLVAAFLFLASRALSATLELGANFNEHLDAARLPVLDATGVKWIRGFLPAMEFIDGRRRLADDPRLATFRTAAASGRRIALTLKWDFLRARTRVPAPGSARERACFEWAVDVVRVGHPDLLLLVNELFIDTPEADLAPGADGAIPMVRFLQRLAAPVHAAQLAAPDGARLAVSCGGFTRIESPDVQQRPATRALLPWLAGAPELTHVNYHIHEPSLAEFEAALAFMARAVPGRPFVVTEFSVVWGFRRHLDDPIAATAAGRSFANTFKRDPAQTVRAYLSAAAASPVTEEELHAFLASQPWFDPGFLEKSCRLMEKHGVVLATYAYLQESSGLERPKAPVETPWRLNPVFQERHARVPGSDRLATNLGFYETFVRRQHAAKP